MTEHYTQVNDVTLLYSGSLGFKSLPRVWISWLRCYMVLLVCKFCDSSSNYAMTISFLILCKPFINHHSIWLHIARTGNHWHQCQVCQLAPVITGFVHINIWSKMIIQQFPNSSSEDTFLLLLCTLPQNIESWEWTATRKHNVVLACWLFWTKKRRHLKRNECVTLNTTQKLRTEELFNKCAAVDISLSSPDGTEDGNGCTISYW
jgi:hypothetical protein